MSRRTWTIAASVLGLLLLGGPVARASQQAWTISPTPNPSSDNSQLFGVACPSVQTCTAVGTQGGGTLVEVWNGAHWTVKPSPNASGATYSQLFGVACPSRSACTAVGYFESASGAAFRSTLVERWNGSRWLVAHTPNPADATDSELRGVACSSPTTCTAVGSYRNSNGDLLPLAESWNGKSWTVQPVPNPAGSTNTGLTGVSCPSPKSCIAVGQFNGKRSPVTLAESWNGTRWTIQPTPTPAGTTPATLLGVACSSRAACTATGFATNRKGNQVTLAMVWNGSRWTIQSTPNPPDKPTTLLTAVACPTSIACTAVGYFQTAKVGFTLAESRKA